MLKLIHCADIHFDAGLDVSDKSRAKTRREEQRETFAGMFGYAAENGVDIIVISGDLFDRKNVTKATLDGLCALFAKYPGIRVAIAPGEHDHWSPDSPYALSAFPDNVYVFKEEKTALGLSFITKDGTKVNIYGSAYASPSVYACPFEGLTVNEPDAVNILLAYGKLSTKKQNDGDFSVSDIIGTGVDYAALGGVHDTDGLHDEENMWYSYAGTLEPVDRTDCGKRGFIYIEGRKEDGDFICKPKFVPVSKREYITRDLSVAGCSGDREIFENVKAFLDGIAGELSERVMLSLTLHGDVSPEAAIPEKEIREEALSRGIFDFFLTDETVPLYNYEYLSADSTIRGAFFNALRPSICSESAEERAAAVDAFRIGLAALDGKDIGQKSDED